MPVARHRRRRHRSKRTKVAKSVKKYVNKKIHQDDETKFFDRTTVAGVGLYDTFSSSGNQYELSNPAQGTTDSTRVGDKLRLRGLRLRFTLVPGDTTQTCRIIVYQYKGNSSLHTPAISEVLQSAYIGVDSPLAPFTHDYRNQFIILMDKTITLDSVSHPVKSYKKKVPLKYAKKQIAFTAGSTDGSNKVYMIAISDSTAAPHPQINFICRLFYDDA